MCLSQVVLMVSGLTGFTGVLVRSHVGVENKQGHGAVRIHRHLMEATRVLVTIKLNRRVILMDVKVRRQGPSKYQPRCLTAQYQLTNTILKFSIYLYLSLSLPPSLPPSLVLPLPLSLSLHSSICLSIYLSIYLSLIHYLHHSLIYFLALSMSHSFMYSIIKRK